MGKKITNYLLIQNQLKKIAGDYAVKLVKICGNKKKPVSDEEIAKQLPLKITEIRTILNRLHYWGAATYNKARNNKTGWYSYTWEIKPKRIAEITLEEHADEIEKLEEKLGFEGGYALFACKKQCEHFPFEVAAEYNFKCPACGTQMAGVDTQKRINGLKRKIGLMRKEFAELKQYTQKTQNVGQK